MWEREIVSPSIVGSKGFFFFFQNNTHFQAISLALVNIDSKIFRKVTSRVS